MTDTASIFSLMSLLTFRWRWRETSEMLPFRRRLNRRRNTGLFGLLQEGRIIIASQFDTWLTNERSIATLETPFILESKSHLPAHLVNEKFPHLRLANDEFNQLVKFLLIKIHDIFDIAIPNIFMLFSPVLIFCTSLMNLLQGPFFRFAPFSATGLFCFFLNFTFHIVFSNCGFSFWVQKSLKKKKNKRKKGKGFLKGLLGILGWIGIGLG